MFRKADQLGRITDHGRADYDPRSFVTLSTNPTHTVTLLVGLPCSRKSTYARSLGLTVLSRDDLITDTFPNMPYEDAYASARADSTFNQRFDKYITSIARKQEDIVVDMTMLSLKARRSMMSHFPHAQFKCEVFIPPLSQTLLCNATRPDKQFKEDLFYDLAKTLTLPVPQEGFTSITYHLGE